MKPLFRTVSLALAALAAQAASAQEFNLYLGCTGNALAGGKTRQVYLDLAMRDNNETALIQRSNVLPMGERLKYTASPMAYTLVYKAPVPGSKVFYDWYRGALFTWNPDLKRLAAIRLAIDRQTAELEGEILNAQDQVLGTLEMKCEPRTMESMPQPRF